MTPGEICRAALSRPGRAGTVLVAAVSVAVIIGETFDTPLLTNWAPGRDGMKINTAYGLLAATGGLWILHARKPGSMWFRVARTLAIVVVVFGG
jgi:hypothetical protein